MSEVDSELLILLPQPPKCQDYRCAPLYLAYSNKCIFELYFSMCNLSFVFSLFLPNIFCINNKITVWNSRLKCVYVSIEFFFFFFQGLSKNLKICLLRSCLYL